MNLAKVLQEINIGREKTEASFVFSLWKNPELYEVYKSVNENSFVNKDAKFYFSLGRAMTQAGIKKFDEITIESFLSNKKKTKDIFDSYGGYNTVSELLSLINIENTEAYYDDIAKRNSLCMYATKVEELFNDIKRFNNATNEDIYNTFELLNNSISLNTSLNEKIESLIFDDNDITMYDSGSCVGFDYGKYCPILNYITLGAAESSIYMVAGHSGVGKTSFTIGSIILGLHYSKVKTAIISNEMKKDAYKILLIEHVLTKELNYYGLTRKAIKQGGYNKEQKEMLKKASNIVKEKYSDILFVKTFDNNISKILKYMRKFKSLGVQVVLYDTFKVDDNVNTNSATWQQLLLDSRKIFQESSKLGICTITTFQLALHSLNQRYLDATALANAKQVKEVYETMIFMRPLWSDEYTGEPHDVKAYIVENHERKPIKLDPEKKYVLFFIDKTRSDDDKQVLIYRCNSRFNDWKEIGFANVENNHNSM